MFIKNGQLIVSESVGVTTTNFAGVLTSADDTVQKALDTLDDHVHAAQTLTPDGLTPYSGILTLTGQLTINADAALAGTSIGILIDGDISGTLTNHATLTGHYGLTDANITNNGKNFGMISTYSQSTLAGGTALYNNAVFSYTSVTGGTANYAYGLEGWCEVDGGTIDVGYGTSHYIANTSGTFNTAYGTYSDIDGTITTVYGLYVDMDDVTGTTWGLYFTGDSKSHMDGNLNLGAGAAYLNFGGTDGSGGYGIRDNSGVIETKDTGGSWNPIANNYVARGNIASADYAVGNFTADASWRDLDLSSIVGAVTALVHLRMAITNDTIDTYFAVRTNGYANEENILIGRTAVASDTAEIDGWVVTDSSGVVEYNLDSGGTWSKVNLSVRGWQLL
jgi:hypothetical protein